jgi:aerobic carbon-monoxide dehydrogenase medium subunit
MQVPSHVEYQLATSVGHALALLGRPGTRVLAGGHSLIPMMKLRLAQPEVLVDINGLAELAFIRLDGDQLRIGALARHADLLSSTVAGEHFPIFHDAERVVADPIVRLWGTVGGSLCQADPSEDLSAVFAATRATAVIRGQDGERTVPVRGFHRGPYETVIGPGELLAEVRVPVLPGTGSAYEKVARRVGDWSVAAAGAVLQLAPGPGGVPGGSGEDFPRDGGPGGSGGKGFPPNGGRGGLGGKAAPRTGGSGGVVPPRPAAPPVIVSAGIGLTAVGAEHFVAAEAEDFLRGRVADSESFAAAAAIAAEHCHPAADQRGPEDYKRHLVAELTTRALRRAAARVNLEA